MNLARRLMLAAFAAAFPFVAIADDKKAETKKAEAKQAEPAEPDFTAEQKKYEEAQKKMLAEMAKRASHEQIAAVKVASADGKLKMQTLTLDAEGRVLALVAPPRSFGAPTTGATAEIQVFSADGKPVETWKIPFHAHSLNAAPDGVVYVAGDGKVAKFSKGKQVGEPVELPHVTELFKDKETLRKNAEETLKKQKEQMAESLKEARKSFVERIAKIEETKEAERTKTQVKQLEQYKQILKQYEEMEKGDRGQTVDSVIAQMTGRVKTINGIAVSDTDVFVACGETAGWGYAIWRFDRELKNPKKVLTDIGGCCGQMDIQIHAADLVVAENTKHSFAKYDRDGKKLGSFGKRGADTDPSCFGGCCNPMNTKVCGSAGDIYTAESEGIVKRFTATGEFKEVAGAVTISGGCKNVAIGVAPAGDKLYFCDQPGSRILILAKKAETKTDGK